MLEDIFVLLFIICRQLPIAWIREYVFRDQLRWGRRVYWLATAVGLAAEFALYLADGRQMGLVPLYAFPLVYVAIFFVTVGSNFKKKVIVWLALDNFYVIVHSLVLLMLVDSHGLPPFLLPDMLLVGMSALLYKRVRGFIDRSRDAFFEVNVSRITNSVISILFISILAQVLVRDYDRDIIWMDFLQRLLYCLPVIWFLYLFSELVREIKLNTQRSIQLQTMERVRRAEIGHYNSIIENWQNLRRVRHDLRHFVLMAGEYLDSGQYDKLRLFLSKIAETTEQSSKVALSGNTIIDALVGYWQAEGRRQGVDVRARLQQQEVHADDVCVTIIVGNLLENAVEAAARTPSPMEKYVDISIAVAGGMLLVKVSNSFNGQLRREEGRFYSAKLGFAQPGLGVENIRTIVQKYDGYMEFDIQEHTFSVAVGIGNRKIIKDL